MVRGVGTKVFWVQTGGYDTHAAQNPNQANGSYTNLMATLNDGLFAFYNDLQNQGLLGDTLVLQFSEFGRRITENGSQGTDHGAASVMMADGRQRARRNLRHGPEPAIAPDNPTLENSGNDVRYETDFRSVYAQRDRRLAGGRLRRHPRRRLQGWGACISVAPLKVLTVNVLKFDIRVRRRRHV